MDRDACQHLPREVFLRRQEALRQHARASGWAGVVAVARSFYDRPANLAYLAQHFPPFPTSEPSPGAAGLGHGLLVLPVRGEPVLVCDFYRADLVAVEDVRVTPDVFGAAPAVLRERGMDRGPVGLVGGDILPTLAYLEWSRALPDVGWVPCDDVLRRMRRVKDEAEVALLRRAAEVADAGLRAALAAARPGTTEREICAAGTAAALRAGADFVRYLRVHTGPWSLYTSRWPQATDRVIGEGDLVCLDIIGAVGGYQFDVLRTTTAGAPPPEAYRLLEAVLAVQDAVLAALRPGVTVAELFAAARRRAEELGFGDALGPLLGHGIGLETVEQPHLIAGVDDRIEAGMVLCVEPTLRRPGLGGASIEDEVVVRPDGIEFLTPTPRRVWVEAGRGG